MKTLRTAVIGLGRIGWCFHLPEIEKNDGFELAAVVDPLLERRVEAENRYGVKSYPATEALLNAENLDLVVIASPTNFHAKQTISAFMHGCDVFCDKPIASTLGDTEKIITAMEQFGRKLMVYQPHRADVATIALKEILRKKLIGPVYMIKRACTSFYRRNDWQAFSKNGGGMLNNYGAHYIDQLLYLSGSRAKTISCSLRTIASLGDADDVVKAVIETENGIILDVDINMAAAHSFSQWHILGKFGSIILDEARSAWKVRYYNPEVLTTGIIHEELFAPQRQYGNIDENIPWQEKVFPLGDFSPVDFYQKCYNYYALDDESFVPIEETYTLMHILDACRKDAESKEQDCAQD